MATMNRILIVYSEQKVCDILAPRMLMAGYEVDMIEANVETIARSPADNYKLALLDINKHDLRADEIIKSLKDMHPDIILVLVSGSITIDTAIWALETGISAFISKPYDWDEILSTIDHCLITETQIRENKILEDRKRKRNGDFQSLFEKSSIGVFRATPDGRVLVANPAFLQIVGEEELSQVSDWRMNNKNPVINLDDWNFLHCLDSEGEVIEFELTWKRNNQQTGYLGIHLNVIRDNNGNVCYYEGVLEDISDNKNAEIESESKPDQTQGVRKGKTSLKDSTDEVQENERQRIPLEIKDDTGQALNNLSNNLETLRTEIPESFAHSHLLINEASKSVTTLMDQLQKLADG